MEAPFATRLRVLTPLAAEDRAALLDLATEQRQVASERQLFAEGGRPQRLHVLLDGWAARVKWVPDGRRHFCALLMPGDVCDIDGLQVRTYDYGVVALTPCTFAMAERGQVLALADARPPVARALAWFGYVDNALLAEAAVSLARRSGRDRMAHLFCELHDRLRVIGRTHGDGYDLPLTQEKLADAIGLTAIHVNRVLSELRRQGLVRFAAGRVTAPDWDALRRDAGFAAAYLHHEGMYPLAA